VGGTTANERWHVKEEPTTATRNTDRKEINAVGKKKRIYYAKESAMCRLMTRQGDAGKNKKRPREGQDLYRGRMPKPKGMNGAVEETRQVDRNAKRGR